MNDYYTYRDIKKILQTTIIGLEEREEYLEELFTMEIKAAYYKAMFYRNTELARKLSKQITINKVNNLLRKSLVQMHEDKDLTGEEYKFCCELYAPEPI